MTMPRIEPTVHTEGDAVPVEPEPPQRLSVEIIDEAGEWSRLGDIAVALQPALDAVAHHRVLAGHWPAEACIALTDDAAMRRLNGQFRSKDKPTNVLSFPAAASPGAPAGSRQIGDIALGYETVVREAGELDIPPLDHIRHLVIHGLLHLMGFDHETDDDAEAMEALEIELLASIGLPNPYEEAAARSLTP